MLTHLICGFNQLTSLDVSKNTTLNFLYCDNNQLTSIDVSKNTILTALTCSNNQLTSLDVSKNTKLMELYCNNNQLTSLDLSSNTNLSHLSCFSNKIKGAEMDALIASLDNRYSMTPKGKLIVISLDDANEGNLITSEQVSAASARSWNVFDSKNNPYLSTCAITLTTSKNIGSKIIFNIGSISNVNIDGVTGSFSNYNTVTYITTKKNITITGYVTSFSCNEDSITSLNVSKDTLLINLACYGNQLTSLDVSQNTKLTQLTCYDNQLTSLDVSNCTALIKFDCSSNQLTSLDVSQNTKLNELDCRINVINTLDVSKNTVLQKLSCGNNQIASLDLSQNTKLNELECPMNGLSSLNVSKNTELYSLYCHDNHLTSLDLTNNTWLINFYCSYNSLTSLDVSKAVNLKELDCSGNQLTSLDLSKNTALINLSCFENQLESLDVVKNTSLEYLLCYSNKIKGSEMNSLVASLIDRSSMAKKGGLYCMNINNGAIEGNMLTKDQVSAALARGWNVFNNKGNQYNGAGVITIVTSKIKNSQIKMRMKVKSGVNIEGATGTFDNNSMVTYTITNDTITVTGDVTYLLCTRDSITSLDVSNDVMLNDLYCNLNPIKTLDLSKNTMLRILFCLADQLNTLDVSKNTALIDLDCSYNNLDTLDVSKNTELMFLFCSDNKLDKLDLSKNTLLESLNCNSNSFKSLDLSHNTELCAIYFANNKIKGTAADALISSLVDRSGMTDKGDMFCIMPNYANEGNVITTEQVAAATARGWNVFDNDSNPYKGIGVIKLTTSGEVGSSIKLAIKAKGNVTIDGANGVASTGKKMNSVAAATPLSNSSEKTYVTTSKTITIIGDITTLDCRENKLETLDVSSCPTLNNLVCSNNKLTTLDVSQNAALDSLDCSHNSLATLDVSKNQALLLFYCNNNKLTALDLINNPLIETLWCYNNGIKGTQMDALISSLSNRLSTTSKGAMQIIDLTSAIEGNIMTTTQVSDAKARGWNIFDSTNKEYAGSVPSGISGINADGATINVIYDTTGQRINQLSRGVNIVKMSDGKIKKVIVK
jgi:Leucine-rich repeat (LRR) protein